ncbi:cell wall hydrolase [Phenylobacterium montanum]|uniref:Cell wall hydrolase n=1 Tax=Phenylobacterium montanum TaxID=2823693 RepID=A0A975G285_9CAUL|nr:cell wall hydrolase [Caulobacter sp. S6]QUD89213.1 cell wall hydrolase [Caulobacter sp. S6]
MAGASARSSDDHLRAARLANAAARQFSEGALRAETQGMAPGAVALAQRHDPLSAAAHDAPTNLQIASPAAVAGVTPAAQALAHPSVMRVSLPAAAGPAARPFRLPTADTLQSARDLDCLTDAVYYEARGETAAGQAAVAQVVLNRVRHTGFPKSVCGVVFQGVSQDGCQFSFACDGSMHRPKEAEAWRRAEQVAARALTGFVMPAVGNATHFHAVGADPGWGPGLLRVAQVGLHVFYRFGGYNGAPASFKGQPQGSTPEDAGQAAPPPIQTASADGARAGGQYILASATVAQPTPQSAPTAKPAESASQPKTEAPKKADSGA